MQKIIYLFVIFFLRIDARLFKGQCRNRPVQVVNPFRSDAYFGIWYEVIKYLKMVKMVEFFINLWYSFLL